MDSGDIEYYRMRESEERAAAAKAHDKVRDIHLAMAERYADAAWSAEEALQARERDRSRGSAERRPMLRIVSG